MPPPPSTVFPPYTSVIVAQKLNNYQYGCPVISPPGRIATKKPSFYQPSPHQAKSTRHQ